MSFLIPSSRKKGQKKLRWAEFSTDDPAGTMSGSQNFEVTTEVTEAVAEAVIKRPPPGVKGIEAEDLQVRDERSIWERGTFRSCSRRQFSAKVYSEKMLDRFCERS